MKIKMYRSVSQINTIVEIATTHTKILLDGGVNLEENEVLKLSDAQAQFDFSEIDAVFLSHYRTDHVTMMRGFLENVPIYAGKLAAKIGLASEKYKAKKAFSFAGFYEKEVPIWVGDIKVTPYLVDDSMYEGYLLLIEGDGKRVIYTGDFRANGRKKFEEMIQGLPLEVDVLICEEGIIGDEDINSVTERDLEEQASALIANKKGPVFILQSVTDFDRTTTIFRAAKRNKRIFLEDLYMSEIAVSAGKAMPNPSGWNGTKAYLTTGYQPEHFRYQMFRALSRVNKTDIETQKFVMCLRPSMKKYMKTLSQSIRFKDGVIINAMPSEQMKSEEVEDYLAFAVKKGLELVSLRNSGHADAKALRVLIEAVHPKKLLPFSVKNARWFVREYPKLAVISSNEVEC